MAALLLSPEEVGKRLGIGRIATYRLIHEGKLRVVRHGRRPLFKVPLSALSEFIERNAKFIGEGDEEDAGRNGI